MHPSCLFQVAGEISHQLVIPDRLPLIRRWTLHDAVETCWNTGSCCQICQSDVVSHHVFVWTRKIINYRVHLKRRTEANECNSGYFKSCHCCHTKIVWVWIAYKWFLPILPSKGKMLDLFVHPWPTSLLKLERIIGYFSACSISIRSMKSVAKTPQTANRHHKQVILCHVPFNRLPQYQNVIDFRKVVSHHGNKGHRWGESLCPPLVMFTSAWGRQNLSESHGNLKPRLLVCPHEKWQPAQLHRRKSNLLPEITPWRGHLHLPGRVGHRQWNLWMGYDTTHWSFPSGPLPSHRSRSWTLPCSAVHLLNRCHHRNFASFCVFWIWWLSATNGCMEYGIMEYVLQRKGMIYDDIWSLFNDINGWSMEEWKIYRRLYPQIFAPHFLSKQSLPKLRAVSAAAMAFIRSNLSFVSCHPVGTVRSSILGDLERWKHHNQAIPSPSKAKKRALYRKVSKKIEISAVWALQIHDLQGFLVSVAFGFQLPCSSLRRNWDHQTDIRPSTGILTTVDIAYHGIQRHQTS